MWKAATEHPFLSACADASIHSSQFNTWLTQDYLFVIDFTRLIGSSLSAAPVEHFDVLLSGIAALQEELSWFREKARERSLDLDACPQPACRAYSEFLKGLAARPYPAVATGLWAIELAYNQAWRSHGPMKAPYDEFAQRWGSDEFSKYVKLLENQADQALLMADSAAEGAAESAFLRVAELEQRFWHMAFVVERAE